MSLLCRLGRIGRISILLGLPVTASGQIIQGHILDDVTGFPLPASALMLLDSAGTAMSWAESDSTGWFSLDVPGPGNYGLYTDRVAYEELLIGGLLLARSDTLDVELRLVPSPIELGGVVVSAERQREVLTRVGFYKRREFSMGHFLDREQIIEEKPVRVTDLLRTVPGVWVRWTVTRGNAVMLRRAFGECLMKVVLDGTKVRMEESSIDEFILPVEVLGIEVYPGGVGAPIQYRGTDAFCGIIMIWTRNGRG